MNKLLTLLFVSLLLSPPAQAADGIARLQQFLHDVDSLKADFTQTVLDAQLNTTEHSTGTFALLRPGKFRWNYITPYEQVIVADGKNLWIYDKTLAQITVKPQTTTLAASPAMLLSGKGDLSQSFNVESLGQQGEWVWIELTPKVKDSDFKTIRIAFDETSVALMELTDLLGQTTRIQFENVQVNPSIEESVFEFTPPDNADVIGTPVE